MEKQQSPLEKYLDEKYPFTPEVEADLKHPAFYKLMREEQRKTATEAYEFALQQPLPPTPELETLLNEKYPIVEEEKWNSAGYGGYNSYQSYVDGINRQRRPLIEFYLAGQKSRKARKVSSPVIENLIAEAEKMPAGQSSLKQGTPTDEDTEKAARAYIKKLPAINYKSAYDFGLQNMAAFKAGIEFRDTYASKQEIDLDRLEEEFENEVANKQTYPHLTSYVSLIKWLKSRPEFKSQLSEEKKGN